MRIQDIPLEELIEKINDTIDLPVERITDINDAEHWDLVDDYLMGREIFEALRGGVPSGAHYFRADMDTRSIIWYRTKNDILEDIKGSDIELYLEDM